MASTIGAALPASITALRGGFAGRGRLDRIGAGLRIHEHQAHELAPDSARRATAPRIPPCDSPPRTIALADMQAVERFDHVVGHLVHRVHAFGSRRFAVAPQVRRDHPIDRAESGICSAHIARLKGKPCSKTTAGPGPSSA